MSGSAEGETEVKERDARDVKAKDSQHSVAMLCNNRDFTALCLTCGDIPYFPSNLKAAL